MRLILTLDIDTEESGLDEARIKEDPMKFSRNLVIIGAEDLQIGLTVRGAECVEVDNPELIKSGGAQKWKEQFMRKFSEVN